MIFSFHSIILQIYIQYSSTHIEHFFYRDSRVIRHCTHSVCECEGKENDVVGANLSNDKIIETRMYGAIHCIHTYIQKAIA